MLAWPCVLNNFLTSFRLIFIYFLAADYNSIWSWDLNLFWSLFFYLPYSLYQALPGRGHILFRLFPGGRDIREEANRIGGLFSQS